MIKAVHLTNFKRFKSAKINLREKGVSIIAGGNNVGKSTLLHALAVWEFAKIYVENEKGPKALFENFKGDGIGISFDDFTPINIPSLKYLWTNLNFGGSYTLKIKCIWDLPGKPDRHLEIAFALTQERLFIKPMSSNLIAGDRIPVIAYLPPFAGISDREQWFSPADRKKMIGRGLAGSVLRNTIMDMFLEHIETRRALKGEGTKMSKAALTILRTTDPFEILNASIFEVFKVILHPQHFSPQFHNYVKVDLVKGTIVNKRFQTLPGYSKRDIMVEGSGFLQWLSVYTYAINNEIDILLLDEPDAHLHCSLQTLLLDKLIEICDRTDKQVLLASHSTELIKYVPQEQVLEVKGGGAAYLHEESQKVALIAGLGTEYSPVINKLQKTKTVIFTENKSDVDFLKIWCATLDLKWPKNLVEWAFANDHKERKQLFHHLKEEIKNLNGISIVDRDNDLYQQTKPDLSETYPDWERDGCKLRYRKWRRWEIENYLICPEAIARVASVDEQAVRDFIQTEFSFSIPTCYSSSDRRSNTLAMFDTDGKIILSAIGKKFNVTKYDIAKEMKPSEIFDDVQTLINEVITMCE